MPLEEPNEGPWEITPAGAANWDDGVEEPNFKLFELAFFPLKVKLPTVICKWFLKSHKIDATKFDQYPSCRKNYQHPLSYIHNVVLKINITCLSLENNTFTNDAATSLSATTPAKRRESGVSRHTLKLLILLQPPYYQMVLMRLRGIQVQTCPVMEKDILKL